MQDKLSSFARDLSLGEQQRVAIAAIGREKTAALLADEPTSSLDDANAEMVGGGHSGNAAGVLPSSR